MSTTVFCTFDQQDLADLAMGKLRNSVKGIYSIQYLGDSGSGYEGGARDDGFSSGWVFAYAPYSSQSPYNANTRPSHPVSVKIVCDDGAQSLVTSKLVNLHAYGIVAS